MDSTALSALSALLWEERQQLEKLLFALVTQQLMIKAGQSRWLGRVDEQVLTAMTEYQDAQVLRAVEFAAVAEAAGLSADISLQELADAAGEPWSVTLGEHRTMLRAVASEIDAMVAENRRLLEAGARAVGETLASLAGFSTTYDASGGTRHQGQGLSFLDEQA